MGRRMRRMRRIQQLLFGAAGLEPFRLDTGARWRRSRALVREHSPVPPQKETVAVYEVSAQSAFTRAQLVSEPPDPDRRIEPPTMDQRPGKSRRGAQACRIGCTGSRRISSDRTAARAGAAGRRTAHCRPSIARCRAARIPQPLLYRRTRRWCAGTPVPSRFRRSSVR
jgi:hypothetical protein